MLAFLNCLFTVGLGFTRFLLGFPFGRLSWVSFTTSFLASPGFLLGFDELYWALLGFTGFRSALLGFTGFYWVLVGFYWVLVGFYWVSISFTGFR